MMTVNRRTTTVLAIIVVILIAVFAITRWQRAVATKKLLADLPTADYAKVMDAKTQLIERGSSIVPVLLDEEHLGNTSSAAARWRSAELLGEVGNRAAIQPLEQALDDESPDVRATAAMALAKLNSKSSGAAILKLLSDEKQDVAVRIAAATALGLLKNAEAVPVMSKALTDTVMAVEAQAWGAYSAWKAATDAIPKAKEALVKAQLLAAGKPLPPPPAPETPAAPAGAAAAAPAAPAAPAPLKAQSPPADPKALADAVTAAEGAVTAAEAAVAPALETRTKMEELVKAVGGRMPAMFDVVVPPGATPDPALAPPADATAALRKACATALGLSGSADGVSALNAALNAKTEPNVEVRVAAAYALADIARVGDGKATDALVAAMLAGLEDEIGDVRAAALHSMASLKDGSAKDKLSGALQKALDDDFYWAREAAKSSMKRLGIPVPKS